jgi:hypothetical protein
MREGLAHDQDFCALRGRWHFKESAEASKQCRSYLKVEGRQHRVAAFEPQPNDLEWCIEIVDLRAGTKSPRERDVPNAMFPKEKAVVEDHVHPSP